MQEAYPDKGPFSMENTAGMSQVLIILKRTQIPGKTNSFVQFNTARKYRGEFLKCWHTFPHIMMTLALSNEAKR